MGNWNDDLQGCWQVTEFENDLVSKTKALAVEKIGQDAKPSGLMRQLHAYDHRGGEARFQQHWVGSGGELWLDIPIIVVVQLPERSVE